MRQRPRRKTPFSKMKNLSMKKKLLIWKRDTSRNLTQRLLSWQAKSTNLKSKSIVRMLLRKILRIKYLLLSNKRRSLWMKKKTKLSWQRRSIKMKKKWQKIDSKSTTLSRCQNLKKILLSWRNSFHTKRKILEIKRKWFIDLNRSLTL